MNTTDAKKVYTVKSAAKELFLSVATVYALVAAGEIEHERHGLGRGTIRIREDALERYRASRTVGGPRKIPHHIT